MEEGGDEKCDLGGGGKPLRDYSNKMQATVADYVALRPIFDVCAKETGYEGRGRF